LFVDVRSQVAFGKVCSGLILLDDSLVACLVSGGDLSCSR
jgi:hypothetical protein